MHANKKRLLTAHHGLTRRENPALISKAELIKTATQSGVCVFNNKTRCFL